MRPSAERDGFPAGLAFTTCTSTNCGLRRCLRPSLPAIKSPGAPQNAATLWRLCSALKPGLRHFTHLRSRPGIMLKACRVRRASTSGSTFHWSRTAILAPAYLEIEANDQSLRTPREDSQATLDQSRLGFAIPLAGYALLRIVLICRRKSLAGEFSDRRKDVTGTCPTRNGSRLVDAPALLE